MALILSGDTGPSIVPASALPAGSVIQLVNGTGTDLSYATSSTYYSTASVTITPQFSSSKIFILYTGGWYPYDSSPASNNQIGMISQLARGATAGTNVIYGESFFEIQISGSSSYTYYANQTMQGYDSPATTSSTTYGLYAKSSPAGYQTRVHVDSMPSSLILLEIAG
jgi:hypothetical protein